MFTLTDCDEYGYTYVVESFPDVDSAREALNFLQFCQDNIHSYRRQLAISELTDQLANYQQS
jgi:hypothetical protein